MRGGRIAAIGLLLAACVTVPTGPPDGPDAMRLEADRASTSARRASIHLAAYAEEARLHGETDVARDRAEQALSVDPRNPYAYLVLARTLSDTGENGAALKMVREAEKRFLAEQPRSVWTERATRLREELESGAGAQPLPGTGSLPVIESRR
jgi:Tfp pilus assembly protein PilF